MLTVTTFEHVLCGIQQGLESKNWATREVWTRYAGIEASVVEATTLIWNAGIVMPEFVAKGVSFCLKGRPKFAKWNESLHPVDTTLKILKLVLGLVTTAFFSWTIPSLNLAAHRKLGLYHIPVGEATRKSAPRDSSHAGSNPSGSVAARERALQSRSTEDANAASGSDTPPASVGSEPAQNEAGEVAASSANGEGAPEAPPLETPPLDAPPMDGQPAAPKPKREAPKKPSENEKPKSGAPAKQSGPADINEIAKKAAEREKRVKEEQEKKAREAADRKQNGGESSQPAPNGVSTQTQGAQQANGNGTKERSSSTLCEDGAQWHRIWRYAAYRRSLSHHECRLRLESR